MDFKRLRFILFCSMVLGLTSFLAAQTPGMPCIDQVNISVDASCTATISPATMQPGVPSGISVGIATGVFPPAALSGGSVINGVYTGPSITINLSLVPTFVSKGKVGPIKVSVFDGSGNSCWGSATIEDKLPPVISDIPDQTVMCIVLSDAKGNPDTSITGAPSTAGTCSGFASLDYRDETSILTCSPTNNIVKTIVRTFYVTNKNGVSSSSVQNITVLAIDVDSILIQPLVEVDCDDDIDPASLADAFDSLSYGYPVIRDTSGAMFPLFPDEAICNVVATFSDSKPIDYCGKACLGGSKILRTWIVVDWCAGETATLTQLIKKVDDEAPSITVASPEKDYSVNAWGCEVDILLPAAAVTDNCDDHSKVVAVDGPIGITVVSKGGRFEALDVPQGTHQFIYTASDCCGNTSTATIELTVIDKIAPVATAKEFITVSLTRSGDSLVTGVAKIFPAQVDNGSYDNCTPVYLEIRREDGAPSCLNLGDLYDHDNNRTTPMIEWNNNVTYNSTINGLDQIVPLHGSDSAFDTDKGQFVKFCCEDIGDTVKVWLRVWDDADGDGIFGTAGDNYNETWANVKVEDKIVPKIYCENDITTSCDRADVFYTPDGVWRDVAGSQIPAEYRPWVDGVCSDYLLEYRDVGSLTVCNTTRQSDPIVRTYRVKGYPQVTCTMTITISDIDSDPILEYPIAVHGWSKCTLTEEEVLANTVRANVPDGFYSEVRQIDGPAFCESVGANILPHAMTTNGLTPTSGSLETKLQGKSRFNPNYKEIGCNVFGRHITIEDYLVGAGCRKWLVKFDYINWCTNSYAGCRATVYKFEDTIPPVIATCPSYTIEVNQASCTASQVVAPVATDAGGCETGFRWTVRLYNAADSLLATRTGTGGAPRFDAFNNLLPGVYDVNYNVADGCGNVAECNGTITVIPKDPTPYCISLSSAVMKDGRVELWAVDFDKGSFLNCDPNGTGVILYTFNLDGRASHPVVDSLLVVHYFKGLGVLATLAEYNAGNAQKWLPEVKETPWPGGTVRKQLVGGTSGMIFGCAVGDPVGTPFTVDMRVWDTRFFNPGTDDGSDFCKVTLSLVNNQGPAACPSASTGGRIVGTVMTNAGEGVSDVETSLNSSLPEFPVKSMTSAGVFSFEAIPAGVEYELSAKKDIDYRNGVNTLDLLKIQRHILSITKLDNAFKYVAADANNDQKVDVSDLVELRKLVLGVVNNLPKNESWRFVDATQEFSDISNPWPLNEVIIAKAGDVASNNFVAVKVGDVDVTASVNANSSNTEIRSAAAVKFNIDEQSVNAGDIINVDVKASNFNEVFGYQFTTELTGLSVVAVQSGAITIEENMYADLGNGKFTMSWTDANGVTVANDAVLFTLKVKADRNTNLSQAIVLNSAVTEAEAYVGADLETINAKLEVRGGVSKGFTLFQNTPNPFKAETNVKFSVSEASQVRFRVYDVTGKVLMNQTINAVQGENTITLRKSDLAANGILYYQLESNGEIATRKMVIIE
ncbi:MAG: T9SS type A sorting domain-containing protein [Saprospiraceae bacterium]